MEPQSGATPAVQQPAVPTDQPATGASTPDQQPQGGGGREPRIGNITATLMVATALLCDLLGPPGAIGGAVIFFIWFKIKGVPLLGVKQVAKQAANLGFNALGEILSGGVWIGVTLGVGITIVLSRVEDATGIDVLTVASVLSAKKGGPATGAVGATTSTVTPTTPPIGGATPTPKPGLADATAEHPVTASERGHYRAANEPVEQGATPAQGATPPPQQTQTAQPPKPTRPPVLSDQDEEVATNIKEPRSFDSLSPREGGMRKQDNTEEEPAPFPGKGSPLFGRASVDRNNTKPNVDSLSAPTADDEQWQDNIPPPPIQGGATQPPSL